MPTNFPPDPIDHEIFVKNRLLGHLGEHNALSTGGGEWDFQYVAPDTQVNTFYR